MLQVNHQSAVPLGLLLLPKLRARTYSNGTNDPGSLTIVVSDNALWWKLNVSQEQGVIEWLDEARKFEPVVQYSYTKLMITMFTTELASHLSAQDVIINAINPSLVLGTEVMRDAKFN
jgi:NAD(P)-dependent dehydrogenase (short-subunit alcohol dehydrogenase family)